MAPGPRNTNDWYDGQDPLALVDAGLVDIVADRAGRRVLDLGCGLGGYSVALGARGHLCSALDIQPRYVARARALGVDARVFDGSTIPFDDKTFDTTFAIEVLEHVAEPLPLLREIGRVTRGSFIATVPNCTQSFGSAGVVFEHMLDLDHKNFFTVSTLRELLRTQFANVRITQIAPVDVELVKSVLPRPAARLYRFLIERKLLRPTHYFRLLAECSDIVPDDAARSTST